MRAHTHAARSAVSHLTQRWEGEGLGGVRAGGVSAFRFAPRGLDLFDQPVGGTIKKTTTRGRRDTSSVCTRQIQTVPVMRRFLNSEPVQASHFSPEGGSGGGGGVVARWIS